MDNSNPLADYNPELLDAPQQPTESENDSNLAPIETTADEQQVTTISDEPITPSQKLDPQSIPQIFSDIDKMVAVIFQNFEEIDSNFGKISQFFFDAAENIEQGRDPKYLSQEEEDVQLLYTVMGYAAKSVGKIVNVANAQSQINQIKPHLKQVAQDRIDHYKEIFVQVKELSEISFNELNEYLCNGGFIDNIKLALKNYREARYHYLLLSQFIIPQFEDWIADTFSNEYYLPDMQDVNNELLFTRESCFFISPIQAKEKLANALENDNPSSKVLLVIEDSGLTATLQVALHDSPFCLTEIAANTSNKESSLYKKYTNNKAVQENIQMYNQIDETDWASTKQFAIYLVRDFLIDIALLIPAYVYFSIGWAIVTTVVLLLITWYNLEKVMVPIQETKTAKEERIRTYAHTLARRSAGEKPKMRQLGTIQKKNKAVVICAIVCACVGAALASIIGFVLGALLGALIGDAFTGSDKIDSLTDGEDWDQIQFGKAIWSKTITILTIVAICLEIYGFFFADNKDIALNTDSISTVEGNDEEYVKPDTVFAPDCSAKENNNGLTDNQLIDRAIDVLKRFPKDKAYTEQNFYELYKLANEIPEYECEGESIMPPYHQQDSCGDDGFTNMTLISRDEKSAILKFGYRTCGNTTYFKLILVNENGDWVGSDIRYCDFPNDGWVSACKEYVESQLKYIKSGEWRKNIEEYPNPEYEKAVLAFKHKYNI